MNNAQAIAWLALEGWRPVGIEGGESSTWYGVINPQGLLVSTWNGRVRIHHEQSSSYSDWYFTAIRRDWGRGEAKFARYIQEHGL